MCVNLSSSRKTRSAEEALVWAFVEYAAKRRKTVAQGFNPGSVMLKRCALKVAQDRSTSAGKSRIKLRQDPWRHFQGASYWNRNPGLKPWDNIYKRFAVNPIGGCASQSRAFSSQPSITPAPFEDNLPRRRLGEGGRERGRTTWRTKPENLTRYESLRSDC